MFFEDQNNSFFLSFGQGVYIFEENPESIQDINGDVCCPGEFCLNRKKCESLGDYVTTPRFLVVESVEHVCLFTSSLCVTRALKDNKYRKNTFSFDKKDDFDTRQTIVH